MSNTNNLNQVIEVLSGILNPDNTIRKQAEKVLDQLRANPKDLIYCLLVTTLSNHLLTLIDHDSSQIQLVAAVLLRKLLEIKDTEMVNPIWKSMTTEEKEQLKSMAIQSFNKANKSKNQRNKECEVLNQMAENVYESSETWEELTKLIHFGLSLEVLPENVDQIEFSLNLLCGISGYIYDDIAQDLVNFLVLMKKFITGQSMDVRVKTIKLLAELVSYSDKKEKNLYKEFIFNILETTLECLKNAKEENNVRISFFNFFSLNSV